MSNIKLKVSNLQKMFPATNRKEKEVVALRDINLEVKESEFVVMVGGGPISQSFANKIGADGYAHEASKASKLAKELINKKKATVKEVV